MIYKLEKIARNDEENRDRPGENFIFKAPAGTCLITEEIAEEIDNWKLRGRMPMIRHFCVELRGHNPNEMICTKCGRVWRITLSSPEFIC